MEYVPLTLKRPIHISQIVSVHYFEYTNHYSFVGESHDFWEFLFVDKGEIDVVAGEKRLHLHKGEMIFHEPGEFHSLQANGVVAPNLIVVGFACESPCMEFFRHRVVTVHSKIRSLLAVIVSQANEAFATPLDDPLLTQLVRKNDQPFGAEQLILLSLEWMLIELTKESVPTVKTESDNVIVVTEETQLFQKIIDYLEQKLSHPLKLADICRDNMVGRSQLERLFQKKSGGGVMTYFSCLKIKKAQEYIREGGQNFTQISASLGFSSLYYFSRQFKKITGMTPTEYATSVKLLTLKTGR